MNRRRALAILGGVVGASAAGLGAGLLAIQPRARRLPPRFPDDAHRPEQLERPKRVVIVGGGLAGLSAALELAERKFHVTLLERGPQLGGRVAGWSVDALGESFPFEHGFHRVLPQSYNLEGLIDRAGAREALSADRDFPLLRAGLNEPQRLASRRAFPLDLLDTLARIDHRSWRERLRELSALLEVTRDDSAQLDSLDFEALARDRRLPHELVDGLLMPLLASTMNRPGRLSAAEAMRFLRWQVTANPEGLGARHLTRSSSEALIEPLRRKLVALGAEIRTGTAAQRLIREGNAVKKVVLDVGAPPGVAALLPAASVPASGFLRAELRDGTPVFVGHRQGRTIAFDGRCTHMGCEVEPDASGGFTCPCHGGRFDAEGRVLRGPPTRPLARVNVAENAEGALVVGVESGARAEELECDHCVIACDVRGSRRLLAHSSLDAPELDRGVEALGEADPYLVLRLWLDRPLRPDREPFYAVAGYAYVDCVALYSNFQEPYRGWARRTNGSVVELQAYAVEAEKLAPPATLRARLLDELWRLLPELAGAKVLHQELLQLSNASRFAPGDLATRPGTETPLANLFLAGDWVKLDQPAFLMEAAVVSGKLAANRILDREGLREVPIESAPGPDPKR